MGTAFYTSMFPKQSIFVFMKINLEFICFDEKLSVLLQVVAAKLGYAQCGLARLTSSVLGVALPKPKKVCRLSPLATQKLSFPPIFLQLRIYIYILCITSTHTKK